MKKRIPAFIAALAIITSSTAAMPVTPAEAASSLPSRVDLSETEYFPDIIDQGLYNSCVPCAAGYYQFTYEARKLLKEKDPNANIDFGFSPLAIYNQINHGYDYGSTIWSVYDFLKVHGAITREQFPYEEVIGVDFAKRPPMVKYLTEDEYNNFSEYEKKLFEKTDDGHYRRCGEYITKQEYEAIDVNERARYFKTADPELYWKRLDPLSVIPNDEKSLLDALKLRIDDPQFIEMDAYTKFVDDEEVELTDKEAKTAIKEGIKKIKKKLAEGKVLVTMSDSDYYDNFTLSATRKGEPFPEQVIYQNKVGYDSMNHALTIVGYDDDIEYDINGDGKIDKKTEKGAFKIASSGGEYWGDNGFKWIMYDALYRESQSGVKEVENPDTSYSFDDFELPESPEDFELPEGLEFPESPEDFELPEGLEFPESSEDFELPEEFEMPENFEPFRRAAFAYAFYIDAVQKDIKLVSQVDLYTNNFYDINVENVSSKGSVETDLANKESYDISVEYNGPVLTDITEICGSKANHRTYKINVNNLNSTEDTKIAVKKVCLKDDKGNIVVKKEFFSDDQVAARFNRLAPGNYGSYELSVDFPAGDMNYDGKYKKDDYKIVKAYFNDPDNSDLSSFQKDLLDADNNGVVDNNDYKILKKTYNK